MTPPNEVIAIGNFTNLSCNFSFILSSEHSVKLLHIYPQNTFIELQAEPLPLPRKVIPVRSGPCKFLGEVEKFLTFASANKERFSLLGGAYKKAWKKFIQFEVKFYYLHRTAAEVV